MMNSVPLATVTAEKLKSISFERSKTWASFLNVLTIHEDSVVEIPLNKIENVYADSEEDDSDEAASMEDTAADEEQLKEQTLRGKLPSLSGIVKLDEDSIREMETEDQDLLDETLPVVVEYKRMLKADGLDKVLNSFDSKKIERYLRCIGKNNRNRATEHDLVPITDDSETGSLHSIDTARYIISSRKRRGVASRHLSPFRTDNRTIKTYRMLQSKRDALREKYSCVKQNDDAHLDALRCRRESSLKQRFCDKRHNYLNNEMRLMPNEQGTAHRSLRTVRQRGLSRTMKDMRSQRGAYSSSSEDMSSEDENYEQPQRRSKHASKLTTAPHRWKTLKEHLRHGGYLSHYYKFSESSFSAAGSSFFSQNSFDQKPSLRRRKILSTTGEQEQQIYKRKCFSSLKDNWIVKDLAEKEMKPTLAEVSLDDDRRKTLKKANISSKKNNKVHEHHDSQNSVKSNKNRKLKENHSTLNPKNSNKSSDVESVDETSKRVTRRMLREANALNNDKNKDSTSKTNNNNRKQYRIPKADSNKEKKNNNTLTRQEKVKSKKKNKKGNAKEQKRNQKFTYKSEDTFQNELLLAIKLSQESFDAKQNCNTLQLTKQGETQSKQVTLVDDTLLKTIKKEKDMSIITITSDEEEANVSNKPNLSLEKLLLATPAAIKKKLKPQPKSAKLRKLAHYTAKLPKTKKEEDTTFFSFHKPICNSTAVEVIPNKAGAHAAENKIISLRNNTKTVHTSVQTTSFCSPSKEDDCTMVSSTTADTRSAQTKSSKPACRHPKGIVLHTPCNRSISARPDQPVDSIQITEQHLSEAIGEKAARKFMKYYMGNRRFNSNATIYYCPSAQGASKLNASDRSDVDVLEIMEVCGELHASFGKSHG